MGSVTQTLACALTSIPTRTMYDVDITQVLVSDPERIKSLAQYKNIHRDFIEDKRSAYWTDGPIKVQNDNRLTQNQRNLAKPKLPHIKYKGDRPSPKWKVSKKASTPTSPNVSAHWLDPNHRTANGDRISPFKRRSTNVNFKVYPPSTF